MTEECEQETSNHQDDGNDRSTDGDTDGGARVIGIGDLYISIGSGILSKDGCEEGEEDDQEGQGPCL
jgi:hypothetical protein